MIAILATDPHGGSYAAYVETRDIHVARREKRRLERLGYSHISVVVCPATATIEDYVFCKATTTKKDYAFSQARCKYRDCMIQ
jgi:hypothetical protein